MKMWPTMQNLGAVDHGRVVQGEGQRLHGCDAHCTYDHIRVEMRCRSDNACMINAFQLIIPKPATLQRLQHIHNVYMYIYIYIYIYMHNAMQSMQHDIDTRILS